jgi:uncharacterized SAM-binding protein YcdF (DUF218 family)
LGTILLPAVVIADFLWRMMRPLVLTSGLLGLVSIVLAFTRIPFDAHRWLGSAGGECEARVELIVVLGGSGMPSGPELLRLHRAAALAMDEPDADLLVVHPQDSAVLDAMVHELILRGVDADRISVLPAGDNTREQALLCARRWEGQEGSIALVTAPENMYRSVLAFRKAGVEQVCGVPAWDHASHHTFRYGHMIIGGKAYLPDVSEAPGLRYTFWNYLKLEITCLREYLAIVYYRLNGWL